MASFTVLSEIETLIQANWTHCEIRGFDADPESPVPSDMSAFAELTFPVDPDETQISFGAPGYNVFREEGGFRFCVMIPHKEPARMWAQRVDALRDALRNWRSSDGHLRIFEVPSAPINNRSDRKGYREISIGVPYSIDIFR